MKVGGSERFIGLFVDSFYRKTHGIVLVYDISDKASFHYIDTWLKRDEKYLNDDVVKLLIGNKCDLKEDRQVSYTEGQDYAERLGIRFFETSAKDCINVEEAFVTMTKEIEAQAEAKEDEEFRKASPQRLILLRYEEKKNSRCFK